MTGGVHLVAKPARYADDDDIRALLRAVANQRRQLSSVAVPLDVNSTEYSNISSSHVHTISAREEDMRSVKILCREHILLLTIEEMSLLLRMEEQGVNV